MKICYIGWAHSIHTQRWIRWFAKRGHNIHLITDHVYSIDGIKIYELNQNKRIIPFDLFGLNYKLHVISICLKIKKILTQIKPDILHLHTLYFPSYLGLLMNFHPLAVTFWNGDLLWRYDWSNLRSFLVNLSFKIADLITVDSGASYKKIVKKKAKRCRLEIVSWGVDLSKFKPADNRAFYQKRLNIFGWPLIISPRGFGKMYNIDVIIEVIPLVLKEFPEAKFLFLGPFKETPREYGGLSLRLGVSQSVEFIGNVPHDILPDYFNASDVMISIPSSDSSPVSLLEGMACGVPPIAGDVEGIKEWIMDNVNGYLVPPRDKEALAQAVIRIVKDKSVTKQFIERNLNLVRDKADQHKHMENVEGFYCELIKKRRR